MKGTVTIDLSDYDFLREQIRHLTEQNADLSAALKAAPAEERKRMGENLRQAMLLPYEDRYVIAYFDDVSEVLLRGEDPYAAILSAATKRAAEVTPQDG